MNESRLDGTAGAQTESASTAGATSSAVAPWVAEFARACRAAARTVALYPSEHAATSMALSRLVSLTASDALTAPVTLAVLPGTFVIDGQPCARGDQAVATLADLLHRHHIGELTIHPSGDADSWRRFLEVLGREPESVRAEGGIGRLWMMQGGQFLDLREIDYHDLMRERAVGESLSWELIVSGHLEGDSSDLNEDTIRALARLAEEPEKLSKFISDIETQAARVGVPARTAAILSMLRGMDRTIRGDDEGRRQAVWRNVSEAFAHLSPELVLDLLAQRGSKNACGAVMPDLIEGTLCQMSDPAIAGFVAREVASHGSAQQVLVEAFHALVADSQRRRDVLSLAHAEVASSEFGRAPGFDTQWASAAAELMLDSYAAQMPQPYVQDLHDAHRRALEGERITDDPAARIAEWLQTVEPAALQALDVALTVDLLRIERDPIQWSELMRPFTSMVEGLLLVGDFESANVLLSVASHEMRAGESSQRQAAAAGAIESIAAGPMVEHITSHLARVSDAEFERVAAVCVSVGDTLVLPLVRALAVEPADEIRDRLTQLVGALGATARQAVEKLRTHPDADIRRTAVYLLYELGGSATLPVLVRLIDDSDPEVRREAVRAIVHMRTERARRVLREALVRGTARSRDTVVQELGSGRSERTVDLLLDLLEHVNHTGGSATLYAHLVELLGKRRNPKGLDTLRRVLYRGDWWAPVRTARHRRAAAVALASIGTADALDLLRQAAADGSRGVRAAARSGLARVGARRA